MGTISGPQGPRVVLDGRPVLLLCSNDYLGLADHARVREAAADAALRFGAGTGSPREPAGTMTVHRQLERRLAEFHGTESALLFGAGYLAAAGAVPALAGTGQVVFSDALSGPAVADGCRLAGAETFVYDHADPDHLAWALRQHGERGGLIVTDGVFAADGDVAPLEDIVGLAHRHGVPVMVDESHALGALGPGGRGAAAEAGLEREVDVIVGSLATALGGHGGYAACDDETARRLAHAPPLRCSTAPPPASAAAALAALELLAEQPGLVDRLAAGAAVLRDELAREGFEVAGASTQIVPLIVGEGGVADAMAAAALEQGVLVQALAPPAVPDGTARLRLTAMATHTRGELREAARVLGRAALRTGLRPATMMPVAEAQAGADVIRLIPRAA
jgi:8-amino-7-oxononanoate synthase